jgi:hypothetical protein
LPLADMVYAALAVGLRDLRPKVDEALAALREVRAERG